MKAARLAVREQTPAAFDRNGARAFPPSPRAGCPGSPCDAGFVRGLLALAVAAMGLAGCGSLTRSATGALTEQLGDAVLGHDDPELVREATPTLLILIDSLADEDASPSVLGSAAQLYAAYGVVFVNDPERSRKLTERAYGYGKRALCAADGAGCGLEKLSFYEYEARISEFPPARAQALYDYVIGYLAWIQARADYDALAQLPRLQRALQRLLSIAPAKLRGRAHMYLGTLQCLRPSSLGGDPKGGMRNFEQALRLTGRRDLSVQLEYARNCARLLYDRALHDSLLEEVLSAEAEQPGLTLFNHLAKTDAMELLSTADDYF